MTASLPVVVIGAGPVGLVAAAHLADRGERPLVLEAGAVPGASVRDWAHVRLFSPWRELIDATAARRIGGWNAPDPDALPTGGELVSQWIEPLAGALAPFIQYRRRVVAITRGRTDKMKNAGRTEAPFELLVITPSGEERMTARAVIDASGTWQSPNPLGANGLPAPGERQHGDRIAYGIPDVLGSARGRYAGKRVLVVGSGHSAFNALLDLAALAEHAPATRIEWAIRRASSATLYGGGSADALAARGELGRRVKRLVENATVTLHAAFRAERVSAAGGGVEVHDGERAVGPVDEIIVTTGFRPDLSLTRELRLSLDPAIECPTALGPLIDPNVHSCGTVRPHGYVELSHPEPGFYTVGMKSYGRAPTFLMLTGYEQVRSVVAAIAGALEEAGDVKLVLPETGVCSSGSSAPGADLAAVASAGGGCGTQAESGCCAPVKKPYLPIARLDAPCGCD